MKKQVIYLLIGMLLTALPAAAEETKFKDVPDDHWAASAIYDLVKMGVTKGYPDGTYRGNKPITRNETAVFLSKLAKAIGGEDIKADIKSLKDDVAALQKGDNTLRVTGEALFNWKVGNILSTGAPHGAAADYRLMMSGVRQLGENARISINLDTMDYGYMNDGRVSIESLTTQLIDLRSDIRLNGLTASPIDLTLSYGPGSVQHTADPTGLFPSEVGITYQRPNTGILATTKLGATDVRAGYLVKGTNNTGKINVSQITGTLGYLFENFPIVRNLRMEVTGDYLSSGIYSSTARDVRAKIDLAAPLAERIAASGTVGFGSSNQHGLLVAGNLALKDIWDTGTVANIQVAKVGSEYISTDSNFSAVEFDFAGLDPFNRPLENSTFNLGGDLVQNVSDDLRLIGRGVLRLDGNYQYQSPKGRLTAEGGISYTIAPNADFSALYRVHQDKSTNDTTDLAALGLNYRF